MICNACNLDKSSSDFYLRKDSGKLRNVCKSCYSEKNKKYRLSNKGKISKMKLKWQRENKDKKAVIAHRYYLKNKKTINDYVKIWKRESRSVKSRIIDNYRSRIHKAIRRKSESTRDLIGCSIDHLMKHLSNQFEHNMSWDNYGEWHIDHIKPCASFDLEDKKQLRECFNYKNLQPLWGIDNQIKSCKITGN